MGGIECVYVYIIVTHYGTFYTGITNSIIRRWKEHCDGKSAYLRKFKPKEVVYIQMYIDRPSAAKEERRIKRKGAKKFLLERKFKA